MRFRLALLAAGATLSMAFADTVTFRDGHTVNGTFLGGNSRQVRVEVGDRIESYDVTDIAKIEFQGAPSAAPAAAEAAPRPRERERISLTQPATSGNSSSAPETAGVDIPAGTVLTVRMIDSVDSEVNQLGQTFAASIDEPVYVNGQVVIPRGADVVAKLVDDKQSGKISGRTELTLDLVSIKVNGRVVEVSTQDVTTSSGSRGNRSAKVIGGTAALGAIIGAIAGGGKGAAIGAGAGAGAGTAVQVATKGQRVKIPAETRLSFTLQNPIRI